MAAFAPAAEASLFTQAVVTSMRNLYPEVLADKSFDNTGLLLETPYDPKQSTRKSNSVLLTIDLTRAVADEAIEGNHSVVIAYHPIIFRGLKSLTLSDTQQASLLRLAANGISVYSPHTAVDIVPGGMADWLCDVVTGKVDGPSPEVRTGQKQDDVPPTVIASKTTTAEAPAPAPSPTPVSKTQQQNPSPTSTNKDSNSAPSSRPQTLERTYSKPAYIQPATTPVFHPDTIPHTRSVITSSPSSDIHTANKQHDPTITDIDTTSDTNSDSKDNNNNNNNNNHNNNHKYTSKNTGHGRIITFTTPQSLPDLLSRIATSLNHPKAITLAIPQSTTVESLTIKTVGLCPGSGGSIFRAAKENLDLLLTGEMSHHEALAVIERGGCVVTLNHSNSERGYLAGVMKGLLEEEIGRVWEGVRGEMVGGGKGEEKGRGWKEMVEDESVVVVVSERDRDPFGVVVLES